MVLTDHAELSRFRNNTLAPIRYISCRWPPSPLHHINSNVSFPPSPLYISTSAFLSSLPVPVPVPPLTPIASATSCTSATPPNPSFRPCTPRSACPGARPLTTPQPDRAIWAGHLLPRDPEGAEGTLGPREIEEIEEIGGGMGMMEGTGGMRGDIESARRHGEAEWSVRRAKLELLERRV